MFTLPILQQDQMTRLSKVSASDQEQCEIHNSSSEGVLDRAALIKEHAYSLDQINISGATDHEKLAYYRACNGDVKKAEQRLQATLNWRQERNVDKLLKDPKMLQKEGEMRRILWYDYLGPDKHGRPVLVERVGRWNVNQVLSTIYHDDKNKTDDDPAANSGDDSRTLCEFQDLHIMSCETLLQMSREQSNNNKPSNNMLDDRGQVVIMDLAGLRPWHLRRKLASAFGRIAKVDSDHYPDTLAHIWIVNAPCLFRALCKMVQHFLDPDTVGKFHVSSTVPKELVECVGEDCLPEELLGKRKGIFPYNESGRISGFPRPV
mmetsp:Transcript_7158/g.16787  ORF Transcript_7158/g.16787 Transcript_7158/m.16787 type:complete len:319 (-) Transcript_7158:141-1097(-)|eukprot:CAMPEP_0113618580 /NCGR_PEP_ID=MMETSP0017_2-20120614/9413_1 /TAXON_ID=2856 /ORGANISM="Cylindrotheca closterium" /LENGTH=318 /DNA_ID=CAMNT_0000528099 /DNA_START=848 /DNA_END=1804 /DNA_ORIENTATION=- /assembly_acc=CAM_ASM_000147